MSTFEAGYAGRIRRRWLTRADVADQKRQAETDRLVAEARLAASFSHRPRPSRLDMHLFDPVARQFDPIPKRRNR